MLRVGVVIFPGSNCDLDAIRAVEIGLHAMAVPLWHKESAIDTDAIILPGGFSYGDYLRPGSIASHSPIMQAVKRFAANGGPVIGICNGFQILTESGLLPGTLLRNTTTRFISQDTSLLVTSNQTPFTNCFSIGQNITLPIAHKDGNYQADPLTLQTLQENHQIVFRYAENPNGSLCDIAGISNKDHNVVGLMPHPERALSDWTRTSDGLQLFQSLLTYLEAQP
jgi:phosphoribosylformylglycinamidine synthase subunit PurQ / glutaminase